MKPLYKLVLQHICKHLVKQGYTTNKDITEYYRIIRMAAQEEFTEDNKPTLDAYLLECFQDSLINVTSPLETKPVA